MLQWVQQWYCVACNNAVDVDVTPDVTFASMEHPLKSFRTRNDLSLDALAERIGVSKATLSRLENKKQDASSDLLRRISEATNGEVTPNDIVLPMSTVPSEAAA